jgi:hypothetical protein
MGGRWTYRTSAAGVLVLAAAAFTLSYDACTSSPWTAGCDRAWRGCGRR